MNPYFGPLEIEAIENRSGTSNSVPDSAEQVVVKFVHYPDCQQLIIWLPQPGFDYGPIRLVERTGATVIDERAVPDRLNGSIQLLWDTLDIAPGAYRIEIEHPLGYIHTITFTKFAEGYQPKKEPVAEPPKPEKTEETSPIVYRDGWGNVIPDEDLLLREKAIQKMMASFNRRVEYDGNLRAGSTTYVEGDLRIPFYHEMGGGNCLVYIDVPAEEQWEAQTKTPLTRRTEILEFVAQTVQREQAPSCRYEIQDSAIVFYYTNK